MINNFKELLLRIEVEDDDFCEFQDEFQKEFESEYKKLSEEFEEKLEEELEENFDKTDMDYYVHLIKTKVAPKFKSFELIKFNNGVATFEVKGLGTSCIFEAYIYKDYVCVYFPSTDTSTWSDLSDFLVTKGRKRILDNISKELKTILVLKYYNKITLEDEVYYDE